MKLHHVGWAVENIEAATALFAGLGYVLEPSLPDRVDPQFQVAIRFLRRASEEALVELIAPAGPASSVSALLKRAGPGPYHLGFAVGDIEAAGRELGRMKFLAVTETVPAPALGNRLIRFWRSPAIGLIELIEWP